MASVRPSPVTLLISARHRSISASCCWTFASWDASAALAI